MDDQIFTIYKIMYSSVFEYYASVRLDGVMKFHLN